MNEMVGGCCVCSDERGWPDNPLVYCDGNGCSVAVHQACYGIVAVPSGPWYCRKCESPDKQTKVRCELCPTKSGALKRTDTNGWAHVVCALYIPEVRFGNVTSMEPIILQLIPQERFNKTCYICQEAGKSGRASSGACMQCNKTGCKQQFHVTCAQSLGLLCEEAGNYIDNVKYCGYCQHHYSKLKKGGNVKTIPPYKPSIHDSHSSDSAGEKEGEEASFAGSKSNSKISASKKGTHSTTPKSTSGSVKSTTTTSTTVASKNHQDKSSKKASSPSESHRKSSQQSTESSGTSSKPSTPAPSPQHIDLSAAAQTTTSKTSSTLIQPNPTKSTIQSNPAVTIAPPKQSPSTSESSGVISSVANSSATSTIVTTSQHTSSSPSPNKYSTTVSFQETVIANNDYIDSKQTKKRKAVSQANMATVTDYSSNNIPNSQSSDSSGPVTERLWDGNTPPLPPDPPPDIGDIKKPKTESPSASSTPVLSNAFSEVNQYSQQNIPSHSQRSSNISMPSPNTSMASIITNTSNLRSPANMQQNPEQQNRVSWQQPHSYETSVAHEYSNDKSLHASNAALRNKKRAALNPASTHTSTMLQPSLHTSIPLPTIQPPLSMTIKRNPLNAPPPAPAPFVEAMKESPPSSPGSERSVKSKSDARLTASQMLGNELNPESSAAMRLSEHLSAELGRLHAASQQRSSHLPPPLLNKATGGRSMAGSSSGSTSSAQSLDQLLERQWEQGSQFLMEQAQHFDIASLLSCLHQLRTENVRLEEHVSGLQQRRDHLLAVNARLAIPLTTVPTGPPEPPRQPPPRQL